MQKKKISKNIKYGTPYPLLYLGFIYTVHSFWLYERYASSAILIMIVIDFACSIIIASETPGWVKVSLRRADGRELGETEIFYYDKDKEAVERIIEEPKLQEYFFQKYFERSSNRNNTTGSGADAQNSGVCGEWCITEYF